MFEGGSIESGDGGELEALRKADWQALHARLRSITRRRVALEAAEMRLLLEADETHLYRRLGYTTMGEYMGRELLWGLHNANERLRVAKALIDLPLIGDLFGDGELCFSAVRELTRVATPETEAAFLRSAEGKTAHQVQQMVAGLKRGDLPTDRPDPALIKKRIVLEVSAEKYALWRRNRTALDDASAARLTDDDLVEALCRAEPAAADAIPRPAVQTAVTTCRACKQTFVESPGEALPIDAATASRLTCDAEHIGDLENDELTRVTPTVPAAIRRKVFHRDHFTCAVPGCRSQRHLDLHHIVHREHGGDHAMTNLLVACFGCHQRHHAGQLTVTGRAPDALVFAWSHDADLDTAMRPRWDWQPAEDPDPPPPCLAP